MPVPTRRPHPALRPVWTALRDRGAVRTRPTTALRDRSAARGPLSVDDLDADALVALALGLGADDPDGADLRGARHVRPAVGLLVQPDDVDHAEWVDLSRNEVRGGADQGGVGVGGVAAEEVDDDVTGSGDLVVDPRLEPAAQL